MLNELEELEEEDGPFQTHVQMVASGMGAAAWVSVASPVLYVTEILNSVPALGDKVGNTLNHRRIRDTQQRARTRGHGYTPHRRPIRDTSRLGTRFTKP